MRAPCVFLWGFLQMLWSPCVFLCVYVCVLCVFICAVCLSICFAIDPSLLKCGSDVPDSCHWVIPFQVSVLVIDSIPLRRRNMIEIAKERQKYFLNLPSICVYSRKLRWLMWVYDPSWQSLRMVMPCLFILKCHCRKETWIAVWANEALVALLLPPSSSCKIWVFWTVSLTMVHWFIIVCCIFGFLWNGKNPA